MTTRPQDIEDERQHWQEYDRQQREAAARLNRQAARDLELRARFDEESA